MPEFTNRISRSLGDKLGERPSALDFIPETQHAAVRAGTTATNLTGWIQEGLNSLANAGGGVLYLPWGVYPVLDLTIPTGVYLQGDGAARTIIRRTGNLSAGRGVLNFAGAKSGCGEVAIDGQVTTPATALYSSLSDPSASLLIANSSIRIHPGASDITLFRCRIFHTGGYAVHIDARTANVSRVEIIEPHLHDNRSFLFGATAGSEIYGSWTGGILAQGDGLTNSYGVRGLTVRDGRFRRGTGNQVWSHLYGFGTLHTDFKIQGCTFEDIGRDGVMLGGVVGGDVAGNFFRRIGYICTDDTSAGIPRWINGQWAVGLDTAGLTRGVSYRGNSFVSCYGAAMDLDGFAEGVVSDNTVIVPAVGEPEYTEDAMASWAGNYCYGVQTSNTNNLADAAVGVRVTGNRFRNCGLGAVRMYASRRGTVSGNTIEHPSAASVAPIILGNIGSGANQRAYANTVTDNDIHYSPGTVTAVVQEDPNGSAFVGSDVNRVYGNRLHGTNTLEFLKAATSGSRTAQEFASNKAGLAAESKTTVQREDGYLRVYGTNGALTKSVLSLLDQTALSGGGAGGPLLNVSLDAIGGVIATGARTSSAFDDALLSSKVYADGFLAIAATTFVAAEANLLADTVGLIRYNATSKLFEQSTSVSAGARVWTPLSPQSLSGLTAGRVPYTTGTSALSDTANLTWSNTGRVLTVTGTNGTASIVAATSFIQSQEGFLTTSAASTAINALSGGVSALSLISIRNDGSAGLNLIRNAGANQRSYGVGVNASGQFFVSDDTAAATRITLNSAGLVTFGSTVSIDQTGNLSASAIVSAAGVNVSGTASNSLQVPSGGVYAGLGATLDQALYLKTLAGNPNSPGTGYGAWAHRSGSTYLYWNGSAWATVDLAGVGAGVTSITGTANQVAASAATGSVALSLPQSIHTAATPTFSTLTITSAASNAIAVTGSVSAAGFAASGTATNQIQCSAGGVTAKYLIGTTSFTLVAESSANAGLSAASQGRIYFDSTTNKFRVSQNGGAYVDLLASGGLTSVNSMTGPAISLSNGAGISVSNASNTVTIANTGVTSLNGTASQVSVSASTGSVTLSLPQNISTNANVTFNAVTLTDALQSNRSIGPAIYAPNAYIQGRGYVSSGLSAYNSIQSDSGISAGTGANGGFYVGSTQVINTSAQFVGAGINVGANGISAGGYNVNGGYSGQTWNVTGSFTINGVSYSTLIFRGGVLVSAA
jgi:hypothetical protein